MFILSVILTRLVIGFEEALRATNFTLQLSHLHGRKSACLNKSMVKHIYLYLLEINSD